jgi:hypothetical protein
MQTQYELSKFVKFLLDSKSLPSFLFLTFRFVRAVAVVAKTDGTAVGSREVISALPTSDEYRHVAPPSIVEYPGAEHSFRGRCGRSHGRRSHGRRLRRVDSLLPRLHLCQAHRAVEIESLMPSSIAFIADGRDAITANPLLETMGAGCDVLAPRH